LKARIFGLYFIVIIHLSLIFIGVLTCEQPLRLQDRFFKARISKCHIIELIAFIKAAEKTFDVGIHNL